MRVCGIMSSYGQWKLIIADYYNFNIEKSITFCRWLDGNLTFQLIRILVYSNKQYQTFTNVFYDTGKIK